MALSLEVDFGGVRRKARVERLDAAEVGPIVREWQLQCKNNPGKVPYRAEKAAYEFQWGKLSSLFGFAVFGLRVEGSDRVLGMVAVNMAEAVEDEMRLAIHFLSKMPVAFEVEKVTGIGRCLVLKVVEMGLAEGLCGRVAVLDAWRAHPHNPNDNPAEMYRGLYFLGAEEVPEGVEYEDLEISAEDAVRLIEENTNAD